MVELVILPGKFESIICHEGRTVVCRCILYNGRKIVQKLQYRFFFFNNSQFVGRQNRYDIHFSCLSQYRTYPCMSILNKRTGVPVKIDRFFGIEGHIPGRIDLQNEVFQGTKPYDPINIPPAFPTLSPFLLLC